MKHIKYFKENINNELSNNEWDDIWKIQTKHIKISLEVLGVPKNNRKDLIDRLKSPITEFENIEYVYLLISKINSIWTLYYDKNRNAEIETANIYNGLVKLSAEEIEQSNMEHESEKYNI